MSIDGCVSPWVYDFPGDGSVHAKSHIRHPSGVSGFECDSPGRNDVDDEMDEADIFFSSPPTIQSGTFRFNLTATAVMNNASPTKRQRVESVEMLPKKYRPRVSGIVLDEFDQRGQDTDEEIKDTSSSWPHTHLRGPTSLTDATYPSGSLSSFQSGSDLDVLATPDIMPGPASGWPGVVNPCEDDDSDYTSMGFITHEDALILRMLNASSKSTCMLLPGSANGEDTGMAPSGSPNAKRPPGTPVKKVKMSHLLERPWQSAVAHKIGFPGFGDRCGTIAGTENVDKRPKGKDRKSLPAAFPMIWGVRQRKNAGVMSPPKGFVEDELDEETSPTTRKYDGLGLGKPPVPPFGSKTRAQWLVRRSSSGAFSNGSEATASRNTTPTRLLAKGNFFYIFS